MSFLAEISLRKSRGQTRESIIALFEADLQLEFPETIVDEPPARPRANQHVASFKNLGSNKFMTNSGRLQQNGGKSISLDSSNIIEYKFQLSEYGSKNHIIIGDGESVLDFAYGHTIPKVVLYPTKHLDRNQRWFFEETPNGTIIHSCYKNELRLVLIQNGDMYTCVPWDSIEGTDQVKFAYWLVIN
jgi:hypothetical protein